MLNHVLHFFLLIEYVRNYQENSDWKIMRRNSDFIIAPLSIKLLLSLLPVNISVRQIQRTAIALVFPAWCQIAQWCQIFSE